MPSSGTLDLASIQYQFKDRDAGIDKTSGACRP